MATTSSTPLRGVVENFALAVHNRAHPLMTPEDSLASVQVIQAAYRAMESEDWAQVEES